MSKVTASTLQFLDKCLCFEYKDTGDTSDEGTLMHKAAETNNLSILETDEQVRMVSAALEVVKVDELAVPATGVIQKEAKFFSPIVGRNIIIDWLGLDSPHSPEYAWVDDYKFGRNGLPVATKDNLQGRTYAATLFEKYPSLMRIKVTFIAPRTAEVDFHEFTREEIEALVPSLSALVDAAHDPFKKPTPNDRCKDCAHMSRCPALADTLKVSLPAILPALEPSKLLAPVSSLTVEELALNMSLVRLLIEYADARKTDINARVSAEDLTLPGYIRVGKAGSTKVSDGPSVLKLMIANGFTLEDITAVTGAVGFEKLVHLYSEKNHVTESQARTELELALGPFLQRSPDITYLRAGKAAAKLQFQV